MPLGPVKVELEWDNLFLRRIAHKQQKPQVLKFVAFAFKPMLGFEPRTPALRKRCSAVELHRRISYSLYFKRRLGLKQPQVFFSGEGER